MVPLRITLPHFKIRFAAEYELGRNQRFQLLTVSFDHAFAIAACFAGQLQNNMTNVLQHK